MAVADYSVLHSLRVIAKLFYTWNKHSEDPVVCDCSIRVFDRFIRIYLSVKSRVHNELL